MNRNIPIQPRSEDERLWDAHYEFYRENFYRAQPRMQYLANLVCSLKDRGRVLDIGIGDGYLLRLLSKRAGFEAYGMDFSATAVKAAEREFSKDKVKAHLQVGDVTEMTYKSGFFDVVVASELFEHLSKDELKSALEQIRRCLKRGGYLIATVPADEDLKTNTCVCPRCGNVFHRWGHKQSFSAERFHSTLGGFFSDVKVSKLIPIPEPSAPLIEKLKFRVRWVASRILPDGFVGNHLAVAKK